MKVMYEPKVTVIIPVYNGANFLSQAIDAALNQDYRNLEVIVVNDGSGDNGASEKIALSYGEKIRYFSKENGGVSSVLNFALERMSGEYFSWLSHDDLYYPQKISAQVAFLNKLLKQNPDIDLSKVVLHTATESIDRDGNVIKTPSYADVPEEEDTIDTIIGNVYNYRLSGCSFLLPAACYHEAGGFREDIRTVSDVEYWYRLLFRGYRFYCLHQILVKNRSHGKQVGKTKVSLFESELDELHCHIADGLAALDASTTRDMERFYLGLRKRGIKKAAAYTKSKYLNGQQSALRNHIIVPVKALGYTAVGGARSLARDIFRKLKVK